MALAFFALKNQLKFFSLMRRSKATDLLQPEAVQISFHRANASLGNRLVKRSGREPSQRQGRASTRHALPKLGLLFTFLLGVTDVCPDGNRCLPITLAGSERNPLTLVLQIDIFVLA